MQLDMEREVAALQRLTVGQLHDRYAEVFGEQTNARNRTYLIRKIAWRIQALAEGDLSERARRRAEELAKDAEVRVMPPKFNAVPPVIGLVTHAPVVTDPRLPMPGTALVRQYKGRTVRVVVLGDGFEYEGERYKSLTAVAKKITGGHCNGFRFFKLEDAK